MTVTSEAEFMNTAAGEFLSLRVFSGDIFVNLETRRAVKKENISLPGGTVSRHSAFPDGFQTTGHTTLGEVNGDQTLKVFSMRTGALVREWNVPDKHEGSFGLLIVCDRTKLLLCT